MFSVDFLADTVLLLTNAVYFKDQWKNSFDPDMTKEENFYSQGYAMDPITVQMMYKEDFFMNAFLPDMKCDALMLPYEVST